MLGKVWKKVSLCGKEREREREGMSGGGLDAALDLVRRLPPDSVARTLEGLLDLAPDLTDELLDRVDQPLQTRKDKDGKEFLCCEFNRDGDAFRSAETNAYTPHLEDGWTPSERLRKIEVHANKVFGLYREMYYEGGNRCVRASCAVD